MTSAEKAVLYELLQSIIQNVPPSKKDLERLNADLREKLLKMDEQIRAAKEKNLLEVERISKESGQLAADRQKVLKQLTILNNLLTDPSSIDRIESYDNPFATGNFEILVRLSKVLRTSGK